MALQPWFLDKSRLMDDFLTSAVHPGLTVFMFLLPVNCHVERLT